MKKKIVQVVLIMTICTFLLPGCGREDAAQITEEPETTKTEEQKPEIQEEADGKEEAAEEVKTEQEVEEQADTTKDVLANERIMNSEPIEEWMKTFTSEDLKFIIYNDVEGYKQILNDGETYHMKKDDKLFLYHPYGSIKKMRILDISIKSGPGDNIYLANGHSVKISWEGQEFVNYGLGILLEGETEERTISCTFYPPSE